VDPEDLLESKALQEIRDLRGLQASPVVLWDGVVSRVCLARLAHLDHSVNPIHVENLASRVPAVGRDCRATEATAVP